MTLKKRFVDRDVLDRDDALLAREINHPVNQEKRMPMRQNPQNVLNVEFDVLGFRCPGSWA